jgi:CRP-like cAMP-binding protein
MLTYESTHQGTYQRSATDARPAAPPDAPLEQLRRNRLLAALPEADLREFAPYLQPVQLEHGQILAEAGQAMRTVYFPTTTVASMVCLMEDGGAIEVAAIGREGVTGMPVLTGGNAMPNRLEVSSAGAAYAIEARRFKSEFERSPALNRLMLLYIQVLMTQIAQSALCNRRHCVDEQLCRWLLLAHERAQSEQLVTTQQKIATMLGVRREGITEAAGKLEAAGLIQRQRGRITVVDREGLEERTCECYSIIKGEFLRLLPNPRSDESEPTRPAVSLAARLREPMHARQW